MRRMVSAAFALFLAIEVFAVTAAASPADKSAADIVVVLDVSGSMNDLDAEHTMADAIRLVIDLAPGNARVALVTANTGVVTDTPLTDVSNPSGRSQLRQIADGITYQGNTDFSAGLEKAVAILESNSDSADKRIIFLGDVGEGGYNASTRYEENVSLLQSLSVRAEQNGVTVDMLFLGESPEDSVTGPVLESIPEKTGGQLLHLDSAEEFAPTMEEMLFSAYSYLQYLHTTSGAQTAEISMPSAHVARARIYIPTSGLEGGIKASYAGANLEVEETNFYSIIHLTRPSQAPISVTVPAGTSGAVDIITLIDYTLESRVTAENSLIRSEGEKKDFQATTFTVDILDSESGESLFSSATPGGAEITPEIFTPNGDAAAIEKVSGEDGSSAWRFFPDSYGTYQVSVSLSLDGAEFTFPDEPVAVENIVPVSTPWVLTIAAACVIGALLITVALVFAYRRRNKKIAHRAGAVQLNHTDYHFNGKLSIRTVLAEGGAREIPPFTFNLEKIRPERRITLKEIYDSSGIPVHFKDIENILFLAGAESGILVKNNTDAQIRIAGREYGKGQAAEVYYNSKIWLRLIPDVDEIEVTYRQARATGEAADRIYFRSARRSR